MWIMGYKIERGQGGLINVTNSILEVLGTFAYTTGSSHPELVSAWGINNSKVSIAAFHEYNAELQF